ncbi:ComF family protein [Jeotgalibacillus proteolyticus]|uniref:Amidophosphoribosyltransferase n=1 Tax=Jeotgalibacillus proteolyticus TaxID=2082395 RepID=A0A2S5GBG5_9BACL|nr:ComF family protein [Jeotgalibacillus proteolyticus]PPA70254.1 amidophosphoribosyltransferase [Jeotgalibacillus proteolyticus]
MKRCISCHEPILLEMRWSDLFTKQTIDPLCSECKSVLKPIVPDRICSICSRQMNEKTYACSDCKAWSAHPLYSDVLHSNRSIYLYSEELKELIKRFKYDRDYYLGACFSMQIKEALSSMAPYDFLVPIPMHPAKEKKRTFNQAEALLALSGLPCHHLLIRAESSSSAQAQKNRHDRLLSQNPFSSTKKLNNQSIVVIDDLYTTGTTIRHAAYALKQAGAGKVSSITVGR